MAMLITALDMFKNFCLVLLLLLAGSLVTKFNFSERKNLYVEKSEPMDRHCTN